MVHGAGVTWGGDLAANPGSANGRFSPVSTAWAAVCHRWGGGLPLTGVFLLLATFPGPLTPLL